ncbi:hypothetical protein EEJ42_22390 [Streptomyces botrytidirepellens]|uniref:Uncharacterized protein n=1 Tax=Streptomyces botrytidirepellens TaxID=2486417 RepID=A0A3M8VUY1_9ACTN|nr:hypothetical protein EEJ42_22390 [Streptomyces botrytidirepellens]
MVLVRVTTRTWERFAPQAGPALTGSTHPGGVHIVQGWNSHQTQALFLTDVEAAACVIVAAAE